MLGGGYALGSLPAFPGAGSRPVGSLLSRLAFTSQTRPRARAGRHRLHLPGCHGSPRGPATARPSPGAHLHHYHRPRRARLLGRPRHRPPPRHVRGIHRASRTAGGGGKRPPRSSARRATLPRALLSQGGAPGPGTPTGRRRHPRLGGRMGSRRPRGSRPLFLEPFAHPGRRVCGHNESARRRLATSFAADERVLVLGFTERMSELLAASDVLVHSTGGVTCLEALVRGCPIVAYRPSPGHARLNAKKMASLGLAQAAKLSARARRGAETCAPSATEAAGTADVPDCRLDRSRCAPGSVRSRACGQLSGGPGPRWRSCSAGGPCRATIPTRSSRGRSTSARSRRSRLRGRRSAS